MEMIVGRFKDGELCDRDSAPCMVTFLDGPMGGKMILLLNACDSVLLIACPFLCVQRPAAFPFWLRTLSSRRVVHHRPTRGHLGLSSSHYFLDESPIWP